MFRSKTKHSLTPVNPTEKATRYIRSCPRCGCPIEGLTLICLRCREAIPQGCSGNCSRCGNHGIRQN